MGANTDNAMTIYKDIKTATKDLAEGRHVKTVARKLAINPTHIYRALQGHYSPTYRRALQRMGIIRTPPKYWVRAWRTCDEDRLRQLEDTGVTVQQIVDRFLDGEL